MEKLLKDIHDVLCPEIHPYYEQRNLILTAVDSLRIYAKS